jgi:hypothetical protein
MAAHVHSDLLAIDRTPTELVIPYVALGLSAATYLGWRRRRAR